LTSLQIEVASSPRQIKEFIRFPFRLYENDPVWVPPLLQAESILHDRRKHPFHRHATVEYFLARRGGRTVGRIASIVNRAHNDYHKDRVGFWGFLDAEDDGQTVGSLLSAAEAFLKGHGMDRSRGPANFSVNETVGLLVEGFEDPPYLMMTHNPRYLPRRVEETGYAKAMDLLAFHVDHATVDTRPFAGVARILKRDDVRVRPLDRRRLLEECRLVNAIYNDAWSDNWGFVPMTEEEIAQMAKELKPIFHPGLSFMVEIRGEPVAFAIALPNVNRLIKKINGRLFPFGWLRLLAGLKSITEIRVLVLGVRKKHQRLGLGVVLCLKMIEDSLALGFRAAELSWILETNRLMIAPLERMGARAYKRYRLYEKPLTTQRHKTVLT
jgi:GNAT superfamily N-acetyltransferase